MTAETKCPKCGAPTRRRRSKNSKGRNFGREYECCSRRSCDHFMWTDPVPRAKPGEPECPTCHAAVECRTSKREYTRRGRKRVRNPNFGREYLKCTNRDCDYFEWAPKPMPGPADERRAARLSMAEADAAQLAARGERVVKAPAYVPETGPMCVGCVEPETSCPGCEFKDIRPGPHDVPCKVCGAPIPAGTMCHDCAAKGVPCPDCESGVEHVYCTPPEAAGAARSATKAPAPDPSPTGASNDAPGPTLEPSPKARRRNPAQLSLAEARRQFMAP